MGKSMIGYFAVAGLLLANAGSAIAWHERGHMAVALIAYRHLDASKQNQIIEILKKHPHYAEFLSSEQPADANANEWVVMRAAVWPDWVREHHKDEGFNQPFHHYVNLPIKRLTGASPAQVMEIEKNIAEAPQKPSSGQILGELPKRLDEVRDPATEEKKRAIALCWVLHLVGDLHQPLHAAALYTKDSPEGDHGGNEFYVKWNRRAEKLHFLWDGVVGWDEFAGPMATPYGVVDLMVRDFQQRHAVTPQELNVTKIDDWAAESRDLADQEVYSYRGTPLPTVFSFGSADQPNPADLPPLPQGYADRARGVAEKRVVVAGLRLVDKLKGVLQ